MNNKNINKEVKNEILEMMEGLKALGIAFEFKVVHNNLTLVSSGYQEPPKPSFECFPEYSPLFLIDQWKKGQKNAKK